MFSFVFCLFLIFYKSELVGVPLSDGGVSWVIVEIHG